jgi:hypothetical protein
MHIIFIASCVVACSIQVVLILFLPITFPADARFRLHCLQGRHRLPAGVLATLRDGDEPERGLAGDPLRLSWISDSVLTLKGVADQSMRP